MKKYILMLGLLLPTLVLANDDWLASDKAVLNYLEAMGRVQSIKNLPIKVPSQLPKDSTYYLSVEKDDSRQYTIYFDTTKDCHGAKYCNVGRITATKLENPQIYYSLDNQPLTREITLQNGNKAYFTPGHPMGDFWPARMEWRDSIWLLQLVWNTKPKQDEQQLLMKLANQITA